MTIDGASYNPGNPAEAISNGVALIHQEIRMIPELSIAENIYLGRLPMKNGRVDSAKLYADSTEVLKKLGVNIDPRRKIRGLSIACLLYTSPSPRDATLLKLQKQFLVILDM